MPERSSLQKEIGQTRAFASPRQEAAIAVLRTADVLRHHFASVLEPHGLTGQQFNVLRILRGARPDALPTMEIASRMIEKTPGITRLLDRLERKGLVARQRGTSDRRRVYCTITDRGLRTLAHLDEPVATADEMALTMLGDAEVARLIELLDAVRAGHA